MRRSTALILGALLGMIVGAAFIRRQTAHRERADLYFEDGSMVALPDSTPQAAPLVELGREAVAIVRGG